MSTIAPLRGALRRAFIVFAATLVAAFFVAAPDARAAGTVTGQLTEPDGTTGVSSGSLTLRTATWSSSWYATPSSTGAFSFTDVPAGAYQLDVWTGHASYFAPASPSVTVTDNQTTALGAVRLLNPNFFCKVTKADGVTAVANASVTVRTTDWTISKYSNTDASGNCKNALTTNGTYVVEVYTNDTTESRPDNQTFTFNGSNVYLDGTNSSQVIRQNIAAVRGRVLIPGNQPAQYANVQLVDSTGVGAQWGSTDVDGYFKIDSVATGTYTLKISPPYTPAGLSAPADISLSLTKGTTNTTYLTTPITLTQSVKRITGTVKRTNGTAVPDANVSMWVPMGNGNASGTVNSTGAFDILVNSGGTWEVSVYPTWSGSTAPDWTYDGTPKQVKFTLPNDQAETQTVNLTVLTYSSTISGTVYKPDGTPVSASGSDYYSVSAWRDQGAGGNWSQVDSSGRYSLKVTPGTLRVSVYGSMTYGAQEQTITIKEGETVTLNLTLLARNATINGLVQDDKGRSVPNVYCSTWGTNGPGWGSGTTDANGRYTIAVTPGDWFVSCSPGGTAGTATPGSGSSGTNYVTTDPPQQVTVAANGTKTVNFLFAVADVQVSGKLVDQNGAQVTSVYGWVNAVRCASSTTTSPFSYYSGLGGSISGGTFTVYLPSGICWRLQASLGYAGDYGSTTASTKEVTPTAGQNISNVELKIVPNTATLSGNVIDAAGTTLTDVYGSVFLTDGYNYRWAPITNGTYSVKTSAGSWTFGCWLDASTTRQYYLPGTCEGTVSTVADTTTTRNITLRKADSTITVTTLKPDGSALPNALVNVSTSFGNAKTTSYATYGYWFNPNTQTDQSGKATFYVPAGTYFVSSSIGSSFGYLNPDWQAVSVSADAPANVTMKFTQPDAIITATVTKDGATYTGGGTCSAWSSEGGYTEATVASDGNCTLGVKKETTWHVQTQDDVSDTTGLASAEKTVAVPASGTASTTLPLDTTIAKPEGTTSRFATDTDQTVTTSNCTITAPANSIATTSTNVSLTMTPTVEDAHNVATDAHVGPAYEIQAVKTSGTDAGNRVTELPKDVTVTITYTDAQLTAAGITDESTLTVKTWSPTTSTYVPMDGSVACKADTNTCSFSTGHLSTFVLTTAPVERKSTDGGTTPGGGGGGDSNKDVAIITPDQVGVELKSRALAILRGGRQPIVTVFAADGTKSASFKPYGKTNVTGSVKMLAANVANDGPEELIIYGQGVPVKVFSLAGTEIARGPSTDGTRTVSAGNLDGSGADELLISSSANHTIAVYRVSGKKFQRLVKFGLPKVGTGTDLRIGNVTGDGAEEIVAAAVGGRRLSVYSVDLTKKKKRARRVAMTNVALASSGKRLVLADAANDGTKEIVVLPAAGSTTVRIMHVKRGKLSTLSTIKAANAAALAIGDLTGDGKADVVALTDRKTPTMTLLSFRKASVSTQVVSASLGGVSAKNAELTIGDFDADNTADVIVTQPTTNRVMVFSYQASQKALKRVTSAYVGGKKSSAGFSALATDLEGRGRRSIVLIPVRGTLPVRIMTLKAGAFSTSQTLKPVGKGAYVVTAASQK